MASFEELRLELLQDLDLRSKMDGEAEKAGRPVSKSMSDELRRLDYFLGAHSPGSWYWQGLVHSISREEYLREITSLVQSGDYIEAGIYIRTYKNKIAMSIECFLKGIIIAHHDKDSFVEVLRDGNKKITKLCLLRGKFATHDLIALADKIDSKRFSISANDKDMLKYLYEYIVSKGRYPVPMCSDRYMLNNDGFIELNGPPKEHFLWERLKNYLREIGWVYKGHEGKRLYTDKSKNV